MTSRLSSMVLRSDFVLEDGDEMKEESKERVKSDDSEGIHVTDDESESETEYDEMFDKMAVIANEENEAYVKENKRKRSKTVTANPKKLEVNILLGL